MRFSPGCNCCGGCGIIHAFIVTCPTTTPVSGATVTVKDSLGATVGTCTTIGSGVCDIAIPAAGTYTVTAAATGHITATVSVSATCSTNTVTIELGRVISVTVKGCALSPSTNTIAGATVTATLGAVSYTDTTDSVGVVKIPVQANGTYAISVTEPSGRLAFSQNVVIACGTTNVAADMVAAPGYHCINWTTTWGCVRYPIADTLFLTDSVYGPCTLTWDNATVGWVGTSTVTTPACSHPSGSWTCPSQAGIPLRYTLLQTSLLNTSLPGGQRNACFPGWFSNALTSCPDTSGSFGSSQVPITAVTCLPAAFSSTHSLPAVPAPFVGSSQMYCRSAITLTVTE